MKIAITVRTADRSPSPNYVGATVRRLVVQGVEAGAIHVCATAPNVDWLQTELQGLAVAQHVPDRRLTANENGLAQLRAVAGTEYDWLLLLEDDLAFCRDFVGSVGRWLRDHGRTDRHVYQLFGFANPPHGAPAAYDVPLERLRASQAIVLRAADAADLLAWGDANLATWRALTPWGSRAGDGTIAWDKFIASWALTRWPGTPGVMSFPHFVRHVGARSTLHARTVANDAQYGGDSWSYQGAQACA